MTEKKIRELAAKLWCAFYRLEYKEKRSVKEFDSIGVPTQNMFLTLARTAVAELKGSHRGRWPKKTNRVCRIGPGGTRHCK